MACIKHVYASESLENMWKVFHTYIAQLKELQSVDFLICGKKVRVLLGGDYHFIDGILGHCGFTSSYPSSVDFVSLKHLQNHEAEKHSIGNCEIILRNIEWYQHYYSENLINTRNKGVMRDHAKYHYSVIEKMLFPISYLIMVVSAILHIVLGVTLRLFSGVRMHKDRWDMLDCR